jgi:hypothetical protein
MHDDKNSQNLPMVLSHKILQTPNNSQPKHGKCHMLSKNPSSLILEIMENLETVFTKIDQGGSKPPSG